MSEPKSKHFILLPAGNEDIRVALKQKLAECRETIKQEGFDSTQEACAVSPIDGCSDAFYQIDLLEPLLKTGRVDGCKLLFEMANRLGYGNFSLSDFSRAEEAVYAYVKENLGQATPKV